MQSLQTGNSASEVPSTPPTIDRKMVWLLAIAGGIAVANLYYIQPLLVDIAHSFSISESTVGIAATVTQLGYALGLLLIVPLGDALERRRLIVTMLILVTVALLATAVAPSLPWLVIASFVVGVTTIIPQIILPLAASLADPEERGRVVGTVMSGLLMGILLARTVSGFIGAQLGWRAMYWIAAALMLLLALLLRIVLPKNQPSTHLHYFQLLRSLGELVWQEPVIREVSLFGAMAFGAFSVLWSTLAFFLSTPPYHYGSEVVGLFGLVGVAGALSASFVGRLSDRLNIRIITGSALAIALLAFVVFWLFGHWLFGLVIGVLLLDLGVQSTQVSNQTRVYRLNPEASNRFNTIYMFSYFAGGSLGSAIGIYGWSVARWNGVCAVGVLMLMVAIGWYFFSRKSTKS